MLVQCPFGEVQRFKRTLPTPRRADDTGKVEILCSNVERARPNFLFLAGCICCGPGGIDTLCLMRGAASVRTTLDIDEDVLTRGEKTITGGYYGSAHLRQDMPRIADWVERGLLDVAGLVTRRYPLANINRAYEDIQTDAVGRGVPTFP